VPEALRAGGVEIRVHDELFPQGTQDVDWLREAGANGWIVITRDDRNYARSDQIGDGAVIAVEKRRIVEHEQRRQSCAHTVTRVAPSSRAHNHERKITEMLSNNFSGHDTAGDRHAPIAVSVTRRGCWRRP